MNVIVNKGFRLVKKITGMVADADHHPDGSTWEGYDYEYLEYFAHARDIEILLAIKKNILPIRPESTPAKIGLAVRSLREQGFRNAGKLVTQEGLIGWGKITQAIVESDYEHHRPKASEYDSMGVMLMAFTDTEMIDEIVAVLWDRGVLPTDMMRRVVLESRKGATALGTGTL